MPRPVIFTPEILATIPALVERGMRRAEIAEMLGCKASSLQVRCSVAGMSLRSAASKPGRPRKLRLHGDEVALSADTLEALRMRAVEAGCSVTRLMSELIETIARDNLFNAVLDVAPLQPELAAARLERVGT